MDMADDAPPNANQIIQDLRQRLDDIIDKVQQVQQKVEEIKQHNIDEIQKWQTIVQSIRYNWSESDVKAEYMQHAKNEAIYDLNNVISSLQQEQQKAEQALQLVQQILN